MKKKLIITEAQYKRLNKVLKEASFSQEHLQTGRELNRAILNHYKALRKNNEGFSNLEKDVNGALANLEHELFPNGKGVDIDDNAPIEVGY